MIVGIKGQQVTGVTIDQKGHIFMNFPRWREGVENSVVQLVGKAIEPFPDAKWNKWEIGEQIEDSMFVCVQSVLAFGNELYVLDTRNPMLDMVKGAPRIYVFDIDTKLLQRTIILDKHAYHRHSYINDLRISNDGEWIYLTDSNIGGLIVVRQSDHMSRRFLDQHPFVSSETSELKVGDKIWTGSVDSDGIALDTVNNELYFHSLSGFTLYRIKTKFLHDFEDLDIEEEVEIVSKTGACDGMIISPQGFVILGDLERQAIDYINEDGVLVPLAYGVEVGWADTFTIHDHELFFTNSKIHLAGQEVSDIEFTLNRIDISDL